MTKVTVLIPFRGSDFSEVYEKGQVYNLESARAQTLASRGLVRIIPEEKQGVTAPAATEESGAVRSRKVRKPKE